MGASCAHGSNPKWLSIHRSYKWVQHSFQCWISIDTIVYGHKFQCHCYRTWYLGVGRLMILIWLENLTFSICCARMNWNFKSFIFHHPIHWDYIVIIDIWVYHYPKLAIYWCRVREAMSEPIWAQDPKT